VSLLEVRLSDRNHSNVYSMSYPPQLIIVVALLGMALRLGCVGRGVTM